MVQPVVRRLEQLRPRGRVASNSRVAPLPTTIVRAYVRYAMVRLREVARLSR